MAQPKRRWSKARTGLKRSTCAHIVMNQCYHIEYVQTVDTIMEKK